MHLPVFSNKTSLISHGFVRLKYRYPVISCVPIALDTRRTHRVRMFPILFIESYLTLFVLVFAFGPWKGPISNPLICYSFLLSVQLALWLGYKSGLRYVPKSYRGRFKIDTLLLISIILSLAYIVPNFYSRLGETELNARSIIESIMMGVMDPGSMYSSRLEALRSVEKTGNPLQYITMIISPLLWMLLPLSILYWERMKKWMRISAVFCITVDALSWIVIGTNKGLVDLAILLPWLLLARTPLTLAGIRPQRLVKLLTLGVVLIALVILYFSIGQYGRFGGNMATSFYDPGTQMQADTDNIVMQCLPTVVQGAYATLTLYMVQGYYALSFALQEPFVFTYGIGNSYFLTGLSGRFFGPATISDMTTLHE